MTASVPDRDFEPEWLWGTRVTAEAARTAMLEGRTRQERFEIYERLISAACAERRRHKDPEQDRAIAERAASIPDGFFGNDIGAGAVTLSGFEETDAN
jgi:hypothetical protein